MRPNPFSNSSLPESLRCPGPWLCNQSRRNSLGSRSESSTRNGSGNIPTPYELRLSNPLNRPCRVSADDAAVDDAAGSDSEAGSSAWRTAVPTAKAERQARTEIFFMPASVTGPENPAPVGLLFFSGCLRGWRVAGEERMNRGKGHREPHEIREPR